MQAAKFETVGQSDQVARHAINRKKRGKGVERTGLQCQVGWERIIGDGMTDTPTSWIPKDLAQSWR